MKKILITGANGRIGQVLTEGLRQIGLYTVITTDINPDAERGIVSLDVRDADALQAYCAGVDTIIHLAWFMRSEAFNEAIVPINIVGTYNLYEAARACNVQRVIFASSNHVTGYYQTGESVTPEMPMRPDSLYGLSKGWGELVGRMYADKYGISSINVRIGNFSTDKRPGSLRAVRIWISHRDVVQLFRCCIEADARIDYLTLYGTSANTRNWYDIAYLEDLIGYKPQDDSEAYVADILRDNPHDQSRCDFQGGRATDPDRK